MAISAQKTPSLLALKSLAAVSAQKSAAELSEMENSTSIENFKIGSIRLILVLAGGEITAEHPNA